MTEMLIGAILMLALVLVLMGVDHLNAKNHKHHLTK